MDVIRKLNYIFNRKQKIEIFWLFIIILIGSGLELLGVSIFSPLINALMDSSKLLDKPVYAWIYSSLGLTQVDYLVVILLATLIVIYIVKNAFLIFMYNRQYRFVFENQRVLANRMFKCYIKQPYLFHVSKNSAELLRNINTDTGNFFGALQAFIKLLTEIMVCLVLGVYLFILDKTITISVIVLLSVTFGISASIYKKLLVKMGDQNRFYQMSLNKWVQQAFGGIKEVKILNKEEFFDKKYDEAYKGHAKSEYRYHTLLAIPKPIIETICMFGMIFAIAVKYLRGASIEYFVPVISAFAVAAFRLLPSFNRITEYIGQIMYQKSAINSVYVDLKEVEELIGLSDMSLTQTNLSFMEEITIKDVSFSYPNSDKEVLSNINLGIKKNTSIAFIGQSGAGKSTLADIVMGLMNPITGDVLLDGVSIFDSLNEWHSIIGYIPQSIYLMDDTIKSNIAFGIDASEIDEKRMEEVIKKAQLTELINDLDDGLETEIGERGVRLSGGQRQRIGIARALYNNPDILILDEATSALDSETEGAVMEAIESLHGQITLIIIAHRLTTIEKCDNVYEVKDSSINLVR